MLCVESKEEVKQEAKNSASSFNKNFHVREQVKMQTVPYAQCLAHRQGLIHAPSMLDLMRIDHTYSSILLHDGYS